MSAINNEQGVRGRGNNEIEIEIERTWISFAQLLLNDNNSNNIDLPYPSTIGVFLLLHLKAA